MTRYYLPEVGRLPANEMFVARHNVGHKMPIGGSWGAETAATNDFGLNLEAVAVHQLQLNELILILAARSCRLMPRSFSLSQCIISEF